MSEPDAPAWTREPKEAGWYWYRPSPKHEPHIASVVMEGDNGAWWTCGYADGLVKDSGFEFLGPLSPESAAPPRAAIREAVESAADFCGKHALDMTTRHFAEPESAVKHSTSTCVWLCDGRKVVLRRDGERAWLEIVPTSTLRVRSPESSAPALSPRVDDYGLWDAAHPP